MSTEYKLHICRGVVLSKWQFQQFMYLLAQDPQDYHDLSVIHTPPNIIVASQCSMSEWIQYAFTFSQPLIRPIELEQGFTKWSRMIKLFPKEHVLKLLQHDELYGRMNQLLTSIENSTKVLDSSNNNLHWTNYVVETTHGNHLHHYLPILFDNPFQHEIITYHSIVFSGFLKTIKDELCNNSIKDDQNDQNNKLTDEYQVKQFGSIFIYYKELLHFYLDEKIPLILPNYSTTPNSLLVHIKATHNQHGCTETIEHLSPYINNL